MDARKLSPDGQVDLRRRVVAAVADGMSQQAAARVFGVSRRAVGVWVRAHRREGPDALNAHRRGRSPGDQCALSRRQQAELLVDLASGGPDSHGWADPLWSRRVLATHIHRRHGVGLSLTTVGHYLARWGLISTATQWRTRVGAPNVVADLAGSGRERVMVGWHRPRPEFVGTALMPGPGSVALGPAPGRVGPPRQDLDVLTAHMGRGAAHLWCGSGAAGLEWLVDFSDRLMATLDRPVVVTICQWPVDQRGLLRGWDAAAGANVRVTRDPR